MKIAIFALALLAFVVGTVELVVAGLLPGITETFGVSIRTAGLLVAIYALVYAVGAPVLIAATAHVERRRLLLTALSLFIVTNLASAMSSSFAMLLILRTFVALSCAVTIVVSIAMAISIAPEEKRGQAIGLIFAGIVGSLVLGVPLGTLAGGYWGWRVVFVAISCTALLILPILFKLLPTLTQPPAPPLRTQLKAAGTGWSLGIHIAALLQMAGQFTVYTYIVPILTSGTGFSLETVSAILMLYGLGGVIGAWFGGYCTDRYSAQTTFLIFLPLHAACIFLLPFSLFSLAALIPLVVLWCVFNMGPGPAMQKFLVDGNSSMALVQIGMNTSAIQTGVALGSFIGGVTYDMDIFGGNAFVGGGLILLSTLVAAISVRIAKAAAAGSKI